MTLTAAIPEVTGDKPRPEGKPQSAGGMQEVRCCLRNARQRCIDKPDGLIVKFRFLGDFSSEDAVREVAVYKEGPVSNYSFVVQVVRKFRWKQSIFKGNEPRIVTRGESMFFELNVRSGNVVSFKLPKGATVELI